MLPMRSMVLSKSKPWNMLLWKCLRGVSSCEASGMVRRAGIRPRRPGSRAVPQAGSQISSFGPGAVISTISWMMCRGVRNWPFWPARGDLGEHVLVDVALGVAVLHRELVEQVHDLGQQARRRDREARVPHVVRVGRALAAQARAGTGTRAPTRPRTSRPGSRSLKRDHRSSTYGRPRSSTPSGKIGDSIGSPKRLALFSLAVWSSSRRRMKSRYVICSITSSGLAMPPDQKASQIAIDLRLELSGQHDPPAYRPQI